MPLSFLNPGLLVGLVAAAVPVIIHFLSRRRLRRVAFSDLRFLDEAEAQQARRRGIRRWLLLLLRVLLIICLVMAAARPHWGGLPGGAGLSTLFVIDASATMQTQDDDGRRRFDAATALVADMITTLPAEASVQVIQAGPQARSLFATWLPAGEPARSALASARATDGAMNLAAALREAERVIADAPTRPVELVLVSDLQLGEQPGLDEALATLASSGTRVLIRQLGDRLADGAVLDVTLPGRALRPGETVSIAAAVRPAGPDQSVWLELDGRRIGETTIDGGDVTTVEFPVTVPGPGLYTGQVGLESDRLNVSDTRPFVLEVPRRLNVLLAHGPDRDGLGRGGWRYVQRALAPDASSVGLFEVRSLTADSLLAVGLDGVDLLIMADVGSPGRRLSGTLTHWLEAGGALMIWAGDPGQADDLADGLLPVLDLPRSATFTVRGEADLERATIVDPAHPLLADLGEPAREALSAARWWRYFTIDEGAVGRVVLAADSGAPLLVEGQLGRGRWALMPFHLRSDATDIMLNPVFLPLVQRLAARLVAGGGAARHQLVGEPLTMPVAASRLGLRPGDSATDLAAAVPGDPTARGVELIWQEAGPVLSAPSLDRAGITAFTVRGDTLGLVASAVPALELTAPASEPSAVADRFRAAGVPRVLDLETAGASGLARALAGRDLSLWLLAAALMLMVVELWIGRRVD